ncbi:histidine kinase [Paenibacillus alkaliterrae]|uniref:sensor histidine kinase n=1 Tax=Paenibacillus alkaliterrae TaxID=320909 RepID=UPI001F2C65A9|nr:histidine kinase [Paenibacillus alkaliterrae]MCF2939522.1 histidine kinase [Paenibacillus alkaliterrae]
MGQIDKNLEDVDKYLISLITPDTDLQTLEYLVSESERYYTKNRLFINLSKNLSSYKSVDGLFAYSVPNEDIIEANSTRTTFDEREEMRSYFKQAVKTKSASLALFSKGWYVVQLDERNYLFRLLKSDGGSFVGAWIDFDNLMIPLNFISLGEKGKALFATDRGEPLVGAEFIQDNQIDLSQDLHNYYLTGNPNHHYLVVGEQSGRGNFSLIALVPDEKILENLPNLRRIATFIPLGSLILIPVYLFLLRKFLLIPINRLLLAMKSIRHGNLDFRIQQFPTSEEFLIVNDTFNSMMAQIQELRIHVYEEKLNKQRAELQHLQLQINPHFYINSLNIMYTLARSSNFALIEEMALCLIQYFRYMFRSNLSFVPLQDELQHIRNYLRIQELRFPKHLKCEIEAPEYLLRAPIPPLIIQSFVENTIKHAVSLDEPILLSIYIQLDVRETESFMKIIIEDTGPGFKKDVLTEIQNGNRIMDEEGEHIGIWNVQQRLRLLYENRAHITFSNASPSGAVVQMMLPLKPNFEQ